MSLQTPRDLHCLKVSKRIQFQLHVCIGIGLYRCLHDTTSIADSLHLAADTDAHRLLRSAADAMMLLIPSTRRSSLGDRVFPVAADRA